MLNLNYNFLETDAVARALAGLKRLRKLTIVGSRMAGTKNLIRMLDAMGGNIEMLDFRYAFLLGVRWKRCGVDEPEGAIIT